MIRDIKSVAATLAEISAAAPHAVEQAAPTDDVDPVLRYIIPSGNDDLEAVKRTSMFDERHRLLAPGSKFAQRLNGAAPPASWIKAWFARGEWPGFGEGRGGGSEGSG